MVEEIEGFAGAFNPFISSSQLPGQPLYSKYRADLWAVNNTNNTVFITVYSDSLIKSLNLK